VEEKMKAADVMSRNVATVTPDTAITEIAEILLGRHISAVPVVDGSGAVVGIVSEGDLIRRQEIGTDKHPSWWLHLLTAPEDQARDYVKSHGHKASDVMTAKLVTVGPDTPLDAVATLLERHHIKRVPVVDGGKLVGIVSRADLIRGLAAHPATLPTPSGDDASLRDAVIAAIRKETGVRTEFINVIVTGGAVHLWGGTNSEDEKKAVRIAAEGVAGDDKVVDHIGVLTGSVRAAMWGE
jgi:CBS-domain-containing membrane protein